ncbi:hypothetical protein BU17DRAFT_66223 [Hysterangium stoloniferum]|nr:hypothetical protein BU17DRAFT_66223 [Hysterangium stoloniferum]
MPARRYLFSCLVILFLSRCVLNGITAFLGNCDSTFPTQKLMGITNGSTLLYDGAIFAVTVYHMWTIVKWRWSFAEMASNKSLGYLIFKQEIESPFTFVSSISILLVLRFFLNLREWHAHRNGTPRTRDLTPCSLYKATVRNFSNAIIDELGDPEDEALFASQAMMVSGQLLRQSVSEAENNDSHPIVNLEEFPWALDHEEGRHGNNTVLGQSAT